MRYTMFVKRGSKWFSSLCGCALRCERFGHGFSAEFAPCNPHFEEGLEPITLEMATEAKSRVTIGCGCSLEHDPMFATFLVPCPECKQVLDGIEESGKVSG